MFLITVFFFLPGRWFTKNSKVIVSIYLLKEIKFILCQLVIYFNSMKNCKTNKEYKIRTVFPNSFIAEKSHKDLLSECFSLLLPLKELLNHYPRHSYCGQVFRTCQPFLFFKLKQVNKRERWKTQRRRDTHTHTHTHTHTAASVTTRQAHLVFYGLHCLAQDREPMSTPHGDLWTPRCSWALLSKKTTQVRSHMPSKK